MKLPIRERDWLLLVWLRLLEMRDPTDELPSCVPEVPAWLLAAMPDFATVGADGLVVRGTRDGVPTNVPICLPESVFVVLEREAASFLLLDTEGVRAVIELPIREVMPELRRLLVLLFEPDCEGVRAVIELPMRELRPRLIRLFELPWETDEDELFTPIELPMRDVKPELMLLRELLCLKLVVGVREALLEFDTEGVLLVMELPIRDVMLRLMLELPRFNPELAAEGVREVRPEIIRLFELVVGLLPYLDTEGAREVTDRLVMLDPILRVELSELDREEIDVRGLVVLNELLRLTDVERLGVRIERELMLLLRLRLITVEELRPRLALEGALILGAGALALGAGRLAELLLLEFELFRSGLAAKRGLQTRIRAEMSARIPILTALRYSNAYMICLLSANDSNRLRQNAGADCSIH